MAYTKTKQRNGTKPKIEVKVSQELAQVIGTLPKDSSTPALLQNRAVLQSLRQSYCPDLDDGEFFAYCTVINATGLDPFRKQIYAWAFNDSKFGRKVAHIIGIDGYRSQGHSTGLTAGIDGPFFEGELKVKVQVWDDVQNKYRLDEMVVPEIARTVIYRIAANGERYPYPGEARWAEFAPNLESKGAGMWPKMPRHQLAKCSEAQAWRKAFPEKFSGTYEAAEMDQVRQRVEGEQGEQAPAYSMPRRKSESQAEDIVEGEVIQDAEPEPDYAPPAGGSEDDDSPDAIFAQAPMEAILTMQERQSRRGPFYFVKLEKTGECVCFDDDINAALNDLMRGRQYVQALLEEGRPRDEIVCIRGQGWADYLEKASHG